MTQVISAIRMWHNNIENSQFLKVGVPYGQMNARTRQDKTHTIGISESFEKNYIVNERFQF